MSCPFDISSETGSMPKKIKGRGHLDASAGVLSDVSRMDAPLVVLSHVNDQEGKFHTPKGSPKGSTKRDHEHAQSRRFDTLSSDFDEENPFEGHNQAYWESKEAQYTYQLTLCKGSKMADLYEGRAKCRDRLAAWGSIRWTHAAAADWEAHSKYFTQNPSAMLFGITRATKHYEELNLFADSARLWMVLYLHIILVVF
jgi:hypothetical protein